VSQEDMNRARSREMLGRRALVTGAASGIGLAIAHDLRSRGAEVVITDLAGEALDRAARDVGAVACIPANLSQRDDVQRLAEASGAIDILVNNAGLQHVSPVESPGYQRGLRLSRRLCPRFSTRRAGRGGVCSVGV